MKNKILTYVKNIYHKYAPQEHHLKDTILHKIMGERIFEPALWKPTRNGIIWAFSIGTFVAFMPVWGGQMIIVGLLAVLFRFNIPVSLLMVWITNPLTAFFIFSLEIRLGLAIMGKSDGFYKVTSIAELFSYITPLVIGGVITSIAMGILAFIVIHIVLKFGITIKEHNHIHMPNMPHIPMPHLHKEDKSEEDSGTTEEK